MKLFFKKNSILGDSFFPNSRLNLSDAPPTQNKYWVFGKEAHLRRKSLSEWWLCVFFFTELLSSMTRTTGKETISNGSFHEAFSSVLVVAQCLAMLPVIGTKGESAYGLRFTWKSFRTIYSATAFCFAASYTIFATYMTLKQPITFNSVGQFQMNTFIFIVDNRFNNYQWVVPLAFFSTTAYGVLSFIILARKWPKLMQHWEFVEAILPPYKTNNQRKILVHDIRKISTIVLFVALGTFVVFFWEYFLSTFLMILWNFSNSSGTLFKHCVNNYESYKNTKRSIDWTIPNANSDGVHADWINMVESNSQQMV